ncbi:hypothetical protein C8A00DRAFT_29105 [Chaetomidium leptoderma]|uniref:Uncharacterized protein n=1 Tax=Chaetomidium leptoderma TaxID=669021 RepID=A0AAN6ZZR7_9PEZI|nr:hypothetical protein C8A00DRAFT_29105 [Chaetomidium leptoderma]
MASPQENRRISTRIQERKRRAEEATEAETRNTLLSRPKPAPSLPEPTAGGDDVKPEPGAQSDASSATLRAGTDDDSPTPNDAPTDPPVEQQLLVCASDEDLIIASTFFLTTHGSGPLRLPPETTTTLDETIMRLCDVVIDAEIPPEEWPPLRSLLDVLLQRRAGDDDGEGLPFEVLDKVLECLGRFRDEEGRRDLAFYRYAIRWCEVVKRETGEDLSDGEDARLWGIVAMCRRVLELRREG